ncbi:MAG TPA: type II secretion system F family protein [Mycobacteriales bacterium]|nr:type II secretion system F family protein [Mycobacteriales bacterium]
MTGALLGLLAGIGALLVWSAATVRPAAVPVASRTSRYQKVGDLLAQAGYPTVRPPQLYVVCGSASIAAFILTAGISHAVTIAAAFAAFAGYAPYAFVKRRRQRRVGELRGLWPDAVDNLGSAVRAGLSLPEALAQLALRGPEPLRPEFARFAADHRATGRFGDCLDRLKSSLADPVADRIVESLRIAREVGGSDLGRLLRTLSGFLREEARTRGEIEARQGWTVAGARLALAAPWVVLAMLSFRPETVAAYDSVAGLAVLVVGGLVSFAAYRLMLHIARLPDDPRVLR